MAVCLIETDAMRRIGAASRLPSPVISRHALLALAGLVFWVICQLPGANAPG